MNDYTGYAGKPIPKGGLKMDREEAEKHWRYTEGIILKMVEVMHYLYVEAMVHGEKHREVQSEHH